GIDMADVEPEVTFDSVVAPPDTTTKSIAAAAHVDAKQVDDLNPQLRKGRTPAVSVERDAPWVVRVPAGKGRILRETMAKPGLRARNVEWYAPAPEPALLTRAPDPSLADPRAALASIRRDPPRPPESVVTDDRPAAVVPARHYDLPGRKRFFYRVAAGDTLGDIAARFGLTEGELCRFNVVDPTARLYEGMLLQAFPLATTDVSRIAHLEEKDVHLLTVGTDDFFDYFEALRGRRRTAIVIDQGDTWERVAKRLKLTVGQLERINQRSHFDKLVPKQTLVVYAPVGKSIPHEIKSPAPAPAPERATLVAPRPDDLPPLPEAAAVSEPSASSP
ncbi:MAG TPA: LysM peptidoglycan-binding domain-containing protein, partial [Polyangiaceae bacterium]